MCNNAGFFPQDISLLKDFASLMGQDVTEMGLCGCWLNEKLLHDKFSETIRFCELGFLEPFDADNPWTVALKGKNVLVIHPFVTSIESQYKKRHKIWSNNNILPDFNLLTIRAVQSIAGEPTGFSTWFDALDSMKNQMDKCNYDIALIGCGAYGFPLAAHAKRTGHKAIHLGGPLQILFGIKGKRWDNIPSVSQYYNEWWIRPLPSETPDFHKNVENGCYW